MSQVISHFARENANVCFIQLGMSNSSSTCLFLLGAGVREIRKDALLSQERLILALRKQNISTSKALWIFMRDVPWTVIIIKPFFLAKMLLGLLRSSEFPFLISNYIFFLSSSSATPPFMLKYRKQGRFYFVCVFYFALLCNKLNYDVYNWTKAKSKDLNV